MKKKKRSYLLASFNQKSLIKEASNNKFLINNPSENSIFNTFNFQNLNRPHFSLPTFTAKYFLKDAVQEECVFMRLESLSNSVN